MSKKIISLVIVIVMLISCLAGCTVQLTDEQLAEMGYIYDPANNGWVKDPANNGWVKDPASNGWVNDPANNGWVNDPANNGWVSDPAGNGWVKDPATNGWVKDPAGNGWVYDPAGNGWVKDPASNGWIPAEGFVPAPKIEGKVIHWIPGAQNANVSYALDRAGETDYYVVLNGQLLEEYVDYTCDEGVFEILGTTLYDMGLGLGKYDGYVFTKGGYVGFEVKVIATATEDGSTIPLKEIKDINLSAIASLEITEPIAGVADLFITEISADMGHYNYVEVFNNTTSTYNLKDHRIVFANLTQQGVSGATNGVFDKALGGASAAYIYQDYEIPALSSAIIWIVNTAPWEVSSNKVSEAAGAQSLILGDGEENLNVGKFKNVYGLDESTLVFPVRTNYMIGRSDYGNATSGWGTALSKSASNRWSDINTSVADRGVQIQKMDETKVFETEDGRFYIIEMDVLNREEDIYADGKLDANDILVANPGVDVAGTNREFIHAVFARRVYVKSATDLTPTDEVETLADTGIDLYNMNTANYYAMFTEGFVTPVATALIYPDLAAGEDGTEAAAKWGKSYTTFALQYQAPAAGEHLSKFIPLAGDRAKYEAMYEGNALALSGLAQEYEGYAADSVVLVPESSAYPTDYLAENHNTAGRVTAMIIPANKQD